MVWRDKKNTAQKRFILSVGPLGCPVICECFLGIFWISRVNSHILPIITSKVTMWFKNRLVKNYTLGDQALRDQTKRHKENTALLRHIFISNPSYRCRDQLWHLSQIKLKIQRLHQWSTQWWRCILFTYFCLVFPGLKVITKNAALHFFKLFGLVLWWRSSLITSSTFSFCRACC